MKVKTESEVAQSCPTLSDPMDCSLPGSSIHGIYQARVLEWVAIAFSEYPKSFGDGNGPLSSVQFSRSVESHSLQPYGLHAARQASLSITKSRNLLKLVTRRRKRHGFDPRRKDSLDKEMAGNPLQCSGLGNPLDREAWRATVHRVAKSRTRLSGHGNH